MSARNKTIRAIDADGHIFENAADVRKYLPAPYRGRTTPLWPGDQPWDVNLGGDLVNDLGYKRDMSPSEQKRLWRDVMDEHDIESAVLFSTGCHRIQLVQDMPFQIAACTAANTLFGKEFTTSRLKPVGVLPMRDPQAAAKELERAVKEYGLVGFEVGPSGLPFALGNAFYDPIYKAAEKLGATIGIHGTRIAAHEFSGDKLGTFAEVHSYAFTAGILLHFTSMLCSGVTLRFPGLKIAFLEIGATWLPYYLDRLNEHWEKRGRVEMPLLKKAPIDVFRKSTIKVSIESCETLLPQTIEYVGAEHLVYATDVPHWDCEFPHNIRDIRATDRIDEKSKKKILYDNAKELFGL